MLRRLLALGLVLSIVAPATGQGIYTEGVVDCGQWVKDRRVRASAAVETYLLGRLNFADSESN
jgi:hypothetical protein